MYHVVHCTSNLKRNKGTWRKEVRNEFGKLNWNGGFNIFLSYWCGKDYFAIKNGLKIQVPCNFCKDQFGQRSGLQNTLQIHVNFTKNSFHKQMNTKYKFHANFARIYLIRSIVFKNIHSVSVYKKHFIRND